MPAGKLIMLVGCLHSYSSKLLIDIGKPCPSAEGNAMLLADRALVSGFMKQAWMKLPKIWPLLCHLLYSISQ